MPTAEWTLALARPWVAPTHVRWRRWTLGAAAAGVVTVLSLSTGGNTCSTAGPGFCVTDPVFPLPIGLLVVSVVLLWWSPLAAAGCALVVAALVGVGYPDQLAVLAAAMVLVPLHLAHLFALRREATTQVALAARSEVAVPDQSRQAAHGTAPPEPVGLHWVVPVGLALLAAASFVLLVRALLTDRADLLAGVELEAPDRTLWALATLACFGASLVLARGVTVRNARAALAAQPRATGLPVRYASADEDGHVLSLVLPADDVVFARLWVTPSPATERPDSPPSAHLSPAVLVGEVRPGGWCALATPAGLVLPTARLEPVGEFPETDVLDEGPDRFVDDESLDPLERLQLWHQPSVGEARAVQLPIRLSLNPLQRAGGILIAVLALGGAWGMLHYLTSDPVEITLTFLVFLALLVTGIGFSVSTVSVDADAYTELTAFRRDVVPLSGVVAVRHLRDTVALVTAAGEIRFIGPLDEGGRNTLTHGLTPGTTAAGVAAAVEHARTLAAHRPPRKVRGGVPPGYPWAALAGAVLLVRVLILFVV